MSGKVMGQAFGLDLRPVELLVLLAYCDHANDDGSNIYPSAKLIAWKTHLSVREVRKITARLVELGVLVSLSPKNLGGHHGNTARYRANLKAIPSHAPCPVSTGEQPFTRDDCERVNSTTQRVNSTTQRVNSCAATGEQLFTQTVIEPSSLEPSRESLSSSATTDDDDVTSTLSWMASECPRKLNTAQLAELSLLVARIPAGQRRSWCSAALAGMADKDLNSPFAWLRRVLNNAVITGKAPGTNGNGKNGNGAPSFTNNSEARKNYYASPKYADIVEH